MPNAQPQPQPQPVSGVAPSLRLLATFAAGCATLSYWIIGEIPSTGTDHNLEPVHLGVALLCLVGVAAISAGTIAAALALRRIWQRQLTLAWLPAAVAVGVSGIALAYFWRVFAMGVDGANIGAGLTFLVADALGLVAVPFVVLAVWRQRRLQHRAKA